MAHEVMRRKLNIEVRWTQGLPFILLSTAQQSSDEVLSLSALFTYALYRTFNDYHHAQDGVGGVVQTKQCMGQHIIQGAAGHPSVCGFLRGAFCRPKLCITGI